MKKLSKLTAAVLVLLLLCGCAPSGYKYVEKGDGSYLVLGSANLKNSSQASGSELQPYVYFNSVAEMKSDIQNGNFTAAEFAEIARFSKNSKGNVAVCSVDNLFEITKPDNFSLEKIGWSGKGYSFYLSRGNQSAYLTICTKESAEKRIRHNFEELKSVTDYDRKEIDEEVNGTTYYFNFTGYPGKRVNYTFTQNGIDYYVSEGYKTDGGKYALYSVEVVGISNAYCFSLLVESGTFSRIPVEVLKQFSLKKYVETEVS